MRSAEEDGDAAEATDTVLVVDFGAQYAQLIARRVRECQVYSEIVPASMPAAEMLARRPRAIILSGGPASVYAPGAPPAPDGLLQAGVPVLGICYGFQLMVSGLGGTVQHTGGGEYGATALEVLAAPGVLLGGQPGRQQVWMSHGDTCAAAPPGFTVTARTDRTPVAAAEDPARHLYGVQFHPEVLHTAHGMEMLLAAALVHRAIGSRLSCVFVDHGLLRTGEAEQVEQDFVAATGVDLTVVDAAAEFLAALAGVTDPEEKRKIIGREFIRAFEQAAREITSMGGGERAGGGRAGGERAGGHEQPAFLVQGTLYPDVVESGGGAAAANIKSHHNVGGLPDDLTFELVEPLRALFKDEVREVGRQLGLPPRIVWRQPFPGPGLAIRIVGEVTSERLRIVRDADAIARAELSAAGLDRDIWQCPVVLLADVRSVGVQGDGRSYGYPVVLRPVTSEDAMTADWARLPDQVLATISTRITNEVPEINRVVLDVTSKPPATIEWE